MVVNFYPVQELAGAKFSAIRSRMLSFRPP